MTKPCPFCQHPGPVTSQQKTLPEFWLVGCPACQASGPLMGTEVHAVEAWNKRGEAMAEPLTREELAALIRLPEVTPGLVGRVAATVVHGYADEPEVGWPDVVRWLDATEGSWQTIGIRHLGVITERLRALGYSTYTYCGESRAHAAVFTFSGQPIHGPSILERPTLVRLTRVLAAVAYGLKHKTNVDHLVEGT